LKENEVYWYKNSWIFFCANLLIARYLVNVLFVDETGKVSGKFIVFSDSEVCWKSLIDIEENELSDLRYSRLCKLGLYKFIFVMIIAKQ